MPRSRSADEERSSGGPAALSRSDRKHQAIVDAATELFLSNGYTRTSVEQIAGLAKVSKQTIYLHFRDKETLLFDIVNTIMASASDLFDHEIALLGESDDLENDLRTHARLQLELVMQPRPLQLRRLVIAESVSFPQLGLTYFERGPAVTIRQLGVAFARLHERRRLRIEDPDRAASDFNWLVMSEPLNRAMLLGHDHPPQGFSLDQWADSAVTTFLAAYRRRQG